MINSTLLSAATARSSGRTSSRIKFSKLFAQPVYRETLSGREEELNDHLGADLPTLSAFGRTWLMKKKGRLFGIPLCHEQLKASSAAS